MSSLQGFPERGSDITLVITKVHLHPLCVLVEFWGTFCQQRTAEYASMAKDIQSAGKRFQEFEGKPGDQCLVLIGGTWYRCRIVSRNDNKYSVFLIDRGTSYNTVTVNLAWGKNKYFQLPPEVEYCVLANTLPVSNDNRWSPIALKFLKYLPGKSVYARVQDVFIAHRTFILDIPSISKQMCEMGLARQLSPEMFRDFVVTSLQPQSNTQVFPEAEDASTGVGEILHQQDVFLYPEISAASVETVVVTHVINPHRLFCQLKVFSKELQKLSDHLSLYCEGKTSRCSVSPEMIGFPCATRRSDGKWCRSVLQQVFPNGNVVEVLNVDCGSKECVQVENVRPLPAEFFRMPVVTYICSLYGIADRCVGWTGSQIDFLKSLLLHKTVIAKFEYQNIFEGVYFVTLHGEENVNLNNLFGSRKSCLLEDYASQRRQYDHSIQPQHAKDQTLMAPPWVAVGDREIITVVEKLPCEDLLLNSSQPAVVQHISHPSEFWIQTFNYTNELHEMMERINGLYKDSVTRNLSNPTVGLYCAAEAKDGDFYRAKVVEVVDEKHIQAFFVDYGNTEVVHWSNVRALPGEFKTLPCLALKCTLAGVKPKDGEWSQGASEYFRHAVRNATVNVQVAAKYNEDFVVCLTLNEAKGENDVGVLMCRAGLAEKAETSRRPKDRMNALCAPSQPDPRTPHVDSSHQKSQSTPPPTSTEGVIAFKMSAFPVGSFLDVTVSYIESPSNFWCQLVQNTGNLKLLMHNIQDYYRNSDFQPVVDAACVARWPDNGMWYRALVLQPYKTTHVKVLLVDYGQTEMVPLCDLRNISPEFLTLPGQALRCSLLNPLDHVSVAKEWDKEATARFQRFVETAASNFVILKCTIFAIMHNDEDDVFNIVDLETPFESTSSSMAAIFKSATQKKYSATSVCLDTYFYSTHSIKVGTEEQMTATCVNSVGEFFCQPNRNADVIINLKVKLNKLCQQPENKKCPTVLGMLCFARYTDGQWYRGQIKATKPAVLVHFVDYGDTIEVKKSDLLPVPKKVNDIMSVPAQAVRCSLSDVPVVVPHKVNRWFQSNVTERTFRALIVAREPDGTLLVELYHDKTQINAELKKMFQIETHADEHVVHQGRRATSTPPERKSHPQKVKATSNVQDTKMTLDTDLKPTRQVCENSQKVKPAPKELYRPPHQRSLRNTGNGFKPAGSKTRAKDGLLPEAGQLESKSLHTKKKVEEKLPKLEDLPSKCIPSGLEADVYVSHCNSPFSFYVQLVREEDELISMVEKLNDPDSSPQPDISQVDPGDLVRAEFADDSSWYRAVVKETSSDTTAVVEFIDFGNTATAPLSKLGTLDKHFLQLPVFSVHCLLFGSPEETLDPEAMPGFKEKMSTNAEKVFKCMFIRQRGTLWEVSLDDGCLDDHCKPPSTPAVILEQSAQTADISGVPENLQKSLPGSSSQRYSQQDFAVGQSLDVCVSSINDNQTFWCLPVDSLLKITPAVSALCNAPEHKPFDLDAVSAGSPCVAPCPSDGLWHRAEVTGKDGDKLRVFFVDKGNTSTVSTEDVKELPSGLLETPPLAFLCELGGFEASRGSWDGDAAKEVSELITETVLQLTVTGVSREEGKIKCFVQVETGGRVINEALKTTWKSSTSDPAAVGPSPEYKTPLQEDPTLIESPRAEDQMEYPPAREGSPVFPLRDGGDEENHGELPGPQTETEPASCQRPGEHLPLESPEEDEDSKNKMEENTRGTLLVEVVNRTVSAAEPEGLRSEDQKVPPRYNKDDRSIEFLSGDQSPETQESREEGAVPAPSPTEQDDLNIPTEQNPTEVAVNSEMDLICLHGDNNSCSCLESTVDSERFSGKLHSYSPLFNLLLTQMLCFPGQMWIFFFFLCIFRCEGRERQQPGSCRKG